MRRSQPSRQAGFSLVELMVALVLGLILTSGVISVYLTSKRDYSLNTALGAVQENGRFAFSFMVPPIRMAGYTGCAHKNVTLYNDLNSTAPTLNLGTPIQGYEYTGTGIGASYTLPGENPAPATSAAAWNPALPSSITGQIMVNGIGGILPGSDVIMLLEADSGGFGLVPQYQDSAGVFLNPSDAAKLTNGELAVMTDCTQASLFQITNANTSSGRVDHSSAGYTPGNSGSNWCPGNGTVGPQCYKKPGTKLLFYNTYVFYIGEGTDGGPSLFQSTMGTSVNGTMGAPQELVPGVENMQIFYGVDTNAPGDSPNTVPNQYLTADQVTNWSQVVAVRIALLTRSDDNATDQSLTNSFVMLDPTAADGVTITGLNDRRLRKVFQATISIRNASP